MLGSLLDGPWPSLLALLEREPRPALAVQLWPSLLCRVRFSSSVWLVTSGLFLARRNEAARSLFFIFYFYFLIIWSQTLREERRLVLHSIHWMETGSCCSFFHDRKWWRNFKWSSLHCRVSICRLFVTDSLWSTHVGAWTVWRENTRPCRHVTRQPLHPISCLFFRVYRSATGFSHSLFLFLLGCPGEREGPDCVYNIAIVWFPHHLPRVCLCQHKTADWLADFPLE